MRADWQYWISLFADAGTMIAPIVSVVALIVALRANYQAELPQVVSYLDFDGDKNTVYFVVANMGKEVAYDLSFSEYDEKIVSKQFRSYARESFIAKGIPILVPGAKRSTVVAAGRILEILERESTPILVTYYVKGFLSKRKEVNEEFVLDYSSYAGSLHTTSDMHAIKVAIEKTEKDLAKIHVAIEQLRG